MIASRPVWLSSVAALVVAGGFALPTQAVAANGLFEFLGSVFGGSPKPPVYEDIDSGGALGVTVHPERRRRSIRRPEASGAKPVNTAINPVDHPNWYLEDPTLRRGDIVVLQGKVLVYEGGGRGSADPASFASLNRSRLLSKAERTKVGAMAGLPAGGAPSSAVAVAPATLPRTAAALGGNE